jgi:hypothetical protein
MITVKKMTNAFFDNDLYLDFWNTCYCNSKDINDVQVILADFTSFQEVNKYFGVYPYVVRDEGRLIGFFFDDRDFISNAIGLSIYIPKDNGKSAYRRMNLILLCGILHNWFIYNKYGIKYLELNTFSAKIVENVLFFVPDFIVYKVRPEYYILHNEIDILNLSFVKDLFYAFLLQQSEENCYLFNIPEYIEKNNRRLSLLEKSDGGK